MMSATIFWRDRPWGSAGGLAGVVFSGILQHLTVIQIIFIDTYTLWIAVIDVKCI